MKKITLLAALYLFILIGLIAVLQTSPTARALSVNQTNHVPGQILVKFKAETSDAVARSIIRGQRGTSASKITEANVHIVKVPEAAETQVVAALANNPYVEYAELDYIAQALVVNDPFYSNQWGLENINDKDIDAPEAWNVTTGNNTVIAILDSGISMNHKDVTPQVVQWANFSTAATSDDIYGHGTHVGGIVAALTNNGEGVAGVCPDCKLMSVKVLNDSGSGSYSAIANGIYHAVANGAKVVNMSLGGSQKSTTLENAVNYAWNNNVVVVAAAGNSGNPSKTYPAAYENAIAVAATDNTDAKASFSEYGSWVDIAAPGVSIFSTWNDNSSPYDPQPTCISSSECYKYASGTSMSTPMTAGVAGLIWSTNKYKTASEVRARLEATADKIDGTGSFWIHGRVNAFNAVDETYVDSSPAPTPMPTKKPRK